jgi:sugar/nucleoside kinase (ribokinase family)
MKDIDVLMIGSPNIDLIVGDYAHFPSPGEEIRVPSMDICCGGGVAITAIGLARLGIRPLLLAAMNEDPFARFIRSEIEKEGVQMIVMPSSVPTGITIALDVSVDRRFITYDGSVYLLSPKDVDDERLAQGRACALAERGWGNAAIAFRLAGEGLSDVNVEAALAELEPEVVRARRAAAGRADRKTWALLARRGFDPETIESVLGPLDETAVGG